MNDRHVVAQFQIPYVQLLDPVGNTVGELPDFANHPAELLAMYRVMVQARVFDTKAVNLQRTGKLGTYPSCLGHEAVHVGVGAALRPEDVVFPVYREIGTKFWRGIEMKDVLLYWGGDERGTLYQNSPQDFPFCVPIGSQMPQAAGAALAFQLRGEARCALGYIGDGGTSQGAFYEAINFAGARALPLVTVIVNNQYAISAPLSTQTACQTLAQKGIAAGIRCVQLDGNDLFAVRQVVAEAAARARSGGGPTVIEALTYRLSDHTTSDDASRYRPADEVTAARKLEPLLRTRAFLEARGLWNQQAEQQLRSECAAAVEDAVRQYLATPRQSTDSMFEHVYAEMPKGLLQQRDQARRHAGHH
jgi:2-oxoisovalerate dehydrogenase E1 component alpha subunit